MTVGEGASTRRVLNMLGIVVAGLEAAVGIALLCMSRHYGSTELGYVAAATAILAVAALTGLPVRVYRNGVLYVLGAMSSALLIVVGLFGFLFALSFLDELAESTDAFLMLLAGSLAVCLAGAIPFMKSARGRADW